MSDDDRDDENEPFDDWRTPRRDVRQPAEGVRIIGAEEAATALETGQASGRRPDDEPRFGDRPAPPPEPRPPLRFPLSDAADPASVRKPRPSAVPPAPVRSSDFARPYQPPPEPEPQAEPEPEPVSTPPSVELPHWTEPATGEVPKILPDAEEGGGEEEAEDDLGAWASLTGGPRWREDAGDWAEADFDPAALADDSARVGALDTTRSGPDEPFSFDFDVPGSAEEPEPVPVRTRAEDREGGGGPAAPGRDVGVAIGTGLAIGIVVLVAAKLGPIAFLLVTIVVLTAATAEIYDAFRQRGYQPATVLGLVATVSLMVAAYNKGAEAFPLLLAMLVAFSLLWYLAGVVHASPAINVGVTVLGFLYVGYLGSFAALLLGTHRPDSRTGVAFLLGAVIATVAYDVGAFFFGSRLGKTPLAPSISPHKTWEGLLGASATTMLVTLIVGHFLHPWNHLTDSFWLAVTVIVVAPLGDLCESMIKRDLGVKDMGSILPGHGGLLDRIDALLFVVPAVFYLTRLLKVGL
jgi:phosphatidate cytidylyltransferase